MHLSLPKWFPLFVLASSVCWSLQCLISTLTQGAKVVTYLGSLAQSCCGEGGAPQTNTTGECGECSQCLAALGLPPLMVCGLSQSTLLRLQVVLQGNCLRRALGCMHFPGLSRSGSGSQVLHKGTDSVGHAFCALPRPEQLRRPDTWRVQSPQAGGSSYHLPGHSSVTWVAKGTPVSGVLCVSSGELISGCDTPSRCQPSRIPRSLG